ncbi:MAG: Fic family protein [Chloroflexi bacterium]|nr:Fic family protein [Chloroflexota bacterium]
MKFPRTPPSISGLLARHADTTEDLMTLFGPGRPVDSRGRYLHWDELRRRKPPEGLNHEMWWLRTAVARRTMARVLPFSDVDAHPFTFCNVDRIQELVHRIDQQASGQIVADEVVTNLQSSDRYLVSSLHEEAITSSQLEGASTTRRVAKEMLQSGRQPRDRSEQMILNNFHAMQAAAALAVSGDPLTPGDILDLHRTVTHDTLDDERDAGRLQGPEDERIAVVWQDGTVLHRPPSAEELPDRLALLCEFANGLSGEGFIHPVVRAILLHFALAYDHPFADGNGRTARALFYWSMLRSGYWLTQYLTISSILRGAPVQYARSYLHVETDGGDATYFVLHQLHVIERAIASLGEYLARKMDEQQRAERLLRDRHDLNHRQHVLISDALRSPDAWFTIQAHERRHRVAYATARADLLNLEAAGLFTRQLVGKQFVFRPSGDLAAQLDGSN